jgi:DNA-binding response OmpR family regulator
VQLLLIGDNSDDLARYGPSLENDGFDVRYDKDPIKFMGAIDAKALGPIWPDLIILIGGAAPVLAPIAEALRRMSGGASLRILAMSAQLGLNDSPKLLRAGVDDVRKELPDPAMCVARARALMRRAPAASAPKDPSQERTRLVSGEFALDLLQRVVTIRGQPYHPTRLQFDILVEILRAGEQSLPLGTLSDALAKRSHSLDAPALVAAVERLSVELGAFGRCVERLGTGGWRLGQLRAEDQTTMLIGELLRAVGEAVHRVKTYGSSNERSKSAVDEVRALIRLIGQAHQKEHVIVKWDAGGLWVDEKPSLKGAAVPHALRLFMASLGIRAIAFKTQVNPGDIAQFFDLARLRTDQAEQIDTVEYLQSKSIASVQVDALPPSPGRARTTLKD